MRRPEAEAEPLAALCLEKTAGNPFFLCQFLKTLHAEGLLAFDPERGAFRWDLEAIRGVGITDNVVELLAARIEKLPHACQRVLRLAACFGSAFDLAALAIAAERPRTEVAADLSPALEEGLVAPTDAGYLIVVDEGEHTARYRFVHDRVQQAAYSRIPEAERPALHLGVGRLLLADAPDVDDGAPPGQLRRARERALDTGLCPMPRVDRSERLFEVVSHLNVGRALIGSPAERERLARLNLAAGTRAMASRGVRAGALPPADRDRSRRGGRLGSALRPRARAPRRGGAGGPPRGRSVGHGAGRRRGAAPRAIARRPRPRLRGPLPGVPEPRAAPRGAARGGGGAPPPRRRPAPRSRARARGREPRPAQDRAPRQGAGGARGSAGDDGSAEALGRAGARGDRVGGLLLRVRRAPGADLRAGAPLRALRQRAGVGGGVRRLRAGALALPRRRPRGAALRPPRAPPRRAAGGAPRPRQGDLPGPLLRHARHAPAPRDAGAGAPRLPDGAGDGRPRVRLVQRAPLLRPGPLRRAPPRGSRPRGGRVRPGDGANGRPVERGAAEADPPVRAEPDGRAAGPARAHGRDLRRGRALRGDTRQGRRVRGGVALGGQGAARRTSSATPARRSRTRSRPSASPTAWSAPTRAPSSPPPSRSPPSPSRGRPAPRERSRLLSRAEAAHAKVHRAAGYARENLAHWDALIEAERARATGDTGARAGGVRPRRGARAAAPLRLRGGARRRARGALLRLDRQPARRRGLRRRGAPRVAPLGGRRQGPRARGRAPRRSSRGARRRRARRRPPPSDVSTTISGTQGTATRSICSAS